MGRLLVVIVVSSVTAVVLAPGPATSVPTPPTFASWGAGTLGQLANGIESDQDQPQFSAGQLAGTVSAISAGWGHACAIVNGAAYCWGRNDWGQLGNGTRVNSSVPTPVHGLDGKTVTDIAAGGAHTCALADGLAYCWGPEDAGRLGTGQSSDTVFTSAQPVSMAGPLKGKVISDITAGFEHTCAVASGKAYCWGWGGEGRLGNGEASGAFNPTPVLETGSFAGRTVDRVEAGDAQTCALSQGDLFCWGQGSSGQLGNGSFADSTTPVKVVGALSAGGVTQFALGTRRTFANAGGSHLCAVATGRAYCWGEGSDGQLGNGSGDDAALPQLVSTTSLGSDDVSWVSAGGRHSCAVVHSRLACWGAADRKQLGGASSHDTAQWLPGFEADATNVVSGADFSTALLVAGDKPGTIGPSSYTSDRTSISFQWQPPADVGNGGPITYDVEREYFGNWQPLPRTGSPETVVTGLWPSLTINLRVRARNDYGIGAWTTISGSTESYRKPGAVQGLTVVGGDRSVTATWQPPADASQKGLVGYSVRVEVETPCRNLNGDPSDEEDDVLPRCDWSDEIGARETTVPVRDLGPGQRVTVTVIPRAEDYGPTSVATGRANITEDTQAGMLEAKISSSTSYPGRGVRLTARASKVLTRGGATFTKDADPCDIKVAWKEGNGPFKTLSDFCGGYILDPEQDAEVHVSFRNETRTFSLRVIKGTNKVRMRGGKLRSGVAAHGMRVSKGPIRLVRKFQDGSWIALRDLPVLEYRRAGSSKWRTMPDKVIHPGFYRWAYLKWVWPARRITLVTTALGDRYMKSICPAVVANRRMYQVLQQLVPVGPIPEHALVPLWLRQEFFDTSQAMLNSARNLERANWPSTVSDGVETMSDRLRVLSTFYEDRADSLWTTSWDGEGWLGIGQAIVAQEIQQDLGVPSARC